MFISCCFLIASLTLYNFATGFWSMVITRVIHGTAYVVTSTSATTRLVSVIPKDKSAQAFGLLSVISLLPFALVPPLLKPLTGYFQGFDGVINISAVLMLINLPLIALLKAPRTLDIDGENLFSFSEIVINLRDQRIWTLLAINLIVWTSYTAIFFYLKGFGDKIGISNPGYFFTVSTLTQMVVRVFAGRLFDKINKTISLMASLILLIFGYMLIGIVTSPIGFYGLGMVLGLGWGIILPVINGFLFDVSAPKFRGLNANLATEMFQAGFTLGPFLGGLVLFSYGFLPLFMLSGLLLLTGIPLTLLSTKDSRIVRDRLVGSKHTGS
jgi:MFS family permease